MTEYGLLETGFLAKPFEVSKSEGLERCKTSFGTNIKTDTKSLFSQFAAIVADRERDLWTLLELVYHSAYLFGASGASLDQLIALAGQARRGATYSMVTLTLGGTNGTLIPADSESWDPVLELTWVHLTSATISGGTASVVARAAELGPVVGLAGTISTPKTVISGWTTVTNALDADPGNTVQSDASVRSNFTLGMRMAGGSSVEGVLALLLKPGIVPGLTEAVALENDGFDPDANGLPGKSFEIIVRGGDDQLIADVIWFSKPAGIESVGTTTMTVTGADGATHEVKFSRATEVEVYALVEYAIDTEGDEFPGGPQTGLDVEHAATDDTGETEMRDAVLALGTSYTIGRDVAPWHLARVIETVGIRELTIRVGLSASPSTPVPLEIDARSYAVLDSTRVTFVRV